MGMSVNSNQYFSIKFILVQRHTNTDAHTHLTGVHPSLQVPSAQHPGSDSIIIQLVTSVPVDDLY